MNARRLRDDVVLGEVDGVPTMFVVTAIPDDAPAAVREGIARRRLATLNGVCPCGAVRPRLTRQQRRAIQRGRFHGHAAIEHEDGCPAIDATLVPLVRAWLRGAP